MRKKSLSIRFVLLSDNHKVGDRGKVDLIGLFHVMGIWATPAMRECSIAIGLSNLSPGRVNLTIWMRSIGKKALRVGNIDLKVEKDKDFQIIANRMPFNVTALGQHEIGVALGENLLSGKPFWIPIMFHKLEWPKLPKGKDLEKAIKKKNTIKSARANLTCKTCGKQYIFQKNLDPDSPLDSDASPFPEDGRLVCGECSTLHHIKDLEGQIIYQLASKSKGGK